MGISRAGDGMALLACATSAWCGVAIARGGVELVVPLVDCLILVATAALLWTEPVQRGSATLLLVAAATLPVGNADVVVGGYGEQLSHAARWWAVVPIAVVLLTYPTATYTRRWHRYLVGAVALDLIVSWGVADLLWDPSYEGSTFRW